MSEALEQPIPSETVEREKTARRTLRERSVEIACARFKAAMSTRSMGVYDVSRSSGVSTSVLYGLTASGRLWNPRTFRRVAQALGVKTAWLRGKGADEVPALPPTNGAHAKPKGRPMKQGAGDEERPLPNRRMRQALVGRNMSLPDLAKRSGIAVSTLRTISAGRTNVSPKTWGRIARGLGIPKPWLFDEAEAALPEHPAFLRPAAPAPKPRATAPAASAPRQAPQRRLEVPYVEAVKDDWSARQGSGLNLSLDIAALLPPSQSALLATRAPSAWGDVRRGDLLIIDPSAEPVDGGPALFRTERGGWTIRAWTRADAGAHAVTVVGHLRMF